MAKKKHEFSKIVLVAHTIIEICVIVYACVMMAITRDLTPMAYLIPAVCVVGSANVASYYSKAKQENKIKLMKQYGVEPTEQSFNEY